MSATWVKLTRWSSGEPLYLNMERAEGVYQQKYIDGTTAETRITFTGSGEEWYSVKETPEQIFAAMQSSAIFPWASLPGSVHIPPTVTPA